MELKAKTFNELTTAELYEILKSRAEVFFLEQKIVCQDMDDVDYDSLHCFFMENGRVTAYLRAFYADADTVKIGRVLTLVHGKGLGRRLMEESIKVIENKMPCKKIHLSAQKYAAGFYEKVGFEITSDDYLEEGIVHVSMDREIKKC